jgi:Flp pilus assembly pilin Flp
MAPALLQIRDWLAHAMRRTNDRGASLVEYALLLVLIAVVLVVAVTVLGETTSEGLSEAGSSGFSGP